MKTFLTTAFLAALGAFLFSSLSFELSASLLFATGFLAIVAADYARPQLRPLAVQLVVVASGEDATHRSPLRLAV